MEFKSWGENMKAKYLTDRGRVREYNEDSGGFFLNTADQMLAIIADGMGGHKAGDIASQMAISVLQEKWKKSEEINTPAQSELWLMESLSEVNQTIYQQALENEAYSGMGTTIVAALITNDFVTIAHIGDSRCYIHNDNGFKQVTEDHSLVNELVRAGQITYEDAQHHPRKNIVLKALGTKEQVETDIKTLVIEAGDKLLLCSDGLTDKIENDELVAFIQRDESINDISQKLIDLANERGGEDNISLIFLHHLKNEEMGETSC